MPTFTGHVDGSGFLPNTVRDDIRDALRSMRGRDVEVVIREPKRKRSLDQNAYLHAEPFPKLAAKFSESVARTKLICMGHFWGWEYSAVAGAMLPVKAHTSDMTVAECTLFIDWLIPWAAEEHGVFITLPEEWQEAA